MENFSFWSRFGERELNTLSNAISHTYLIPPLIRGFLRLQMPSHRQGFAIAAFQDKIYVIGGWNSINPNTGIAITLGTNEMYDPASDTCTTKAPMPIADIQHGS